MQTGLHFFLNPGVPFKTEAGAIGRLEMFPGLVQ